MIKLIVLDRDGVINEDLERPIVNADEWVPIEGSLDAIARLSQNGWSVAVVTNQSGISRGLLDLAALHDIHKSMHEQLNQIGGKIDVVAFCPHSDSDECACRKPAPGMLYTISERLGVDLNDVIMVGDSLRDIQAAMAAAVSPVIVRTGKGQQTLDTHKGLEHIPAFDNLASYVDDLLAREAIDKDEKSEKAKGAQAKATPTKSTISKSSQTGKSVSSKTQSTKAQGAKAATGKSSSGKTTSSKNTTSKAAQSKAAQSKSSSSKN